MQKHLNKLCKLLQADEVVSSCCIESRMQVARQCLNRNRGAGVRAQVLFEKATFLVISHATQKEHTDQHRYEKISNIIKQFKLSCMCAFQRRVCVSRLLTAACSRRFCSKTQSAFKSMEVKNKNFTSFIDSFTSNTYIMIILSNPKIREQLRRAAAVVWLWMMLRAADSSCFPRVSVALLSGFPERVSHVRCSVPGCAESAAINLNIQVARPHFEKFVSQSISRG